MPPAELPDNEPARLDALLSCGVLDTDSDPAFDGLTRLAADLLGVPIALISLVDRYRQWFKSRVGLEERQTPREQAFCAYAILQSEPFIIEDAAKDPRTRDNPLVTGPPHIRFYAGCPLMLEDGLAVGTLCVIDTQPRSLTDSQVCTLSSLAAQATQLLRLYRHAAREAKVTAALDAANDSVFLFDPVTLRFDYTNRAASEQVGYAPAELKSLTPLDIKPSFDEASFRRLVDPLIDQPSLCLNFQTDHQHRDGHLVPVEVRVQYVPGVNRFLGIARDVSAQLSEQRTLQQAHERFELAIEGSRDAIFDWDLEHGAVYFSPRWAGLLGVPESSIGDDISWLFGRIAPADVADVRRELYKFAREGDSHLELQFRLAADEGRVLSVLLGAAAKRDQSGAAKRIIGSVSDISSTKRVEEQLKRLVQRDQLTGLASRRRLTARLEHALRRSARTGRCCGILFMDFDRFKVINDSLGHDIGDELLCSIARRLQSNIRKVDTAARFGGDEFVILLEDLPDSGAARVVAEKLLRICAQPHYIRGRTLVSTASIGLVTSDVSSESPAVMLRDADAAMYQAKARGRGMIVEFDRAMHEANLEKLELEVELHRALATDQLSLHYQPIVELETGVTVGAEALARWRHPTRGWIPPLVFVAIAEESNQIHRLGDWVVREACRQITEWKARAALPDGFTVSVNLSKAQLITPGFVDHISSLVGSSGLTPKDLKLEVTETTIVDNRAGVADVLRELRARGFVVMMDDFGTGHSSLSGLHELPIDELKIDQSFIRHESLSKEIVAITSSIVTLAAHLSLRTVGEGIETIEHIALLQDLGCHCGQGYYFSRPLPAAEFEAWLQRTSHRKAA